MSKIFTASPIYTTPSTMSFSRTLLRTAARLPIRSAPSLAARPQPCLLRLVHQSGPPTEPPQDPYPLPLDPVLAKRRQESLDQLNEELEMPPPIDRTGESEEVLRARLVYQTRKRGTLEADLILGTFAKENLRSMDEKELMEFDKLLDEPDWDIYYWAIGKREPPARWNGTPLLEKLKQHAKNEGRVVRVMPDLNDQGGL